MIELFGDGLGTIIAAAALAGAPASPNLTEQIDRFPIVELRQYTLREGQRDRLIDLFERQFIEPQEALGMKVIGTFVDLDRPNRFVWLRGFRDMDSRLSGLSAFYGGPVWAAHRDAANSTMLDSDNVLLLHAPDDRAEFRLPDTRPALGANAPAGLVTATIYPLKADPSEAERLFADRIAPALAADGVLPIAWFVTETSPNNFPRLPVREGERVLVWFAAFADDADRITHGKAFNRAHVAIAPLLSGEPELLRLAPTGRSLIRGVSPAASSGANGFDFLHGSWWVLHRRLNPDAGNSNWTEFEGEVEVRPLLGGLCNVEEHQIPRNASAGIALRCFERTNSRWAIYWVSQRDGLLQPPVYGNFIGDEGRFEGDDTVDGRPIRVRFIWKRDGNDRAHWEQAFSYDQGATWVSNWTMRFERN